jgi:segregation and condensation protein B
MFGSKVYDHVKVLIELGLIHSKLDGRTSILTTTHQFAEYFGIDTTDREKIKLWLMKKVQQPDIGEEEIETKTTDTN